MQNLALKNWYWRFENAELSDPDLVVALSLSVCDACGLDHHDSRLQLLLGEMLSNAIDHGVLGLDSMIKNTVSGFDKYLSERRERLSALSDEGASGWVSVSVDSLGDGKIQIVVEDSGTGFSTSAVNRSQSSEGFDCFGRGLKIIESLSSSMMHLGSGNCIVVEFDTIDRVVGVVS